MTDEERARALSEWKALNRACEKWLQDYQRYASQYNWAALARMNKQLPDIDRRNALEKLLFPELPP